MSISRFKFLGTWFQSSKWLFEEVCNKILIYKFMIFVMATFQVHVKIHLRPLIIILVVVVVVVLKLNKYGFFPPQIPWINGIRANWKKSLRKSMVKRRNQCLKQKLYVVFMHQDLRLFTFSIIAQVIIEKGTH